jgi:hypothetical protein
MQTYREFEKSEKYLKIDTFYKFHIVVSMNVHTTLRAGWHIGNALKSYSAGVWFESRAKRRYPDVFLVFPSVKRRKHIYVSYQSRCKLIFIDLGALRNASKFSQQRGVRHNRYYITAFSDDYGGTKEISFASFIVQGSRHFIQHKGVSCYTHVPQFKLMICSIFSHIIIKCLSSSPC